MMVRKIGWMLVLALFVPLMTATAQTTDTDAEREIYSDPAVITESEKTLKRFHPGDCGYFGFSGAFVLEDFDHDSTDLLGYKPDYDNGYGVNIYGGYRYVSIINGIALGFEADMDYLTGFDWSKSNNVDSEIDIFMISGVFKAGLDYPISPYAFTGLGLMYAMADTDIHSLDYDEDELGVFTKLGLGVDFFLGKHFAFMLEGDYSMGFGKVDKMSFYRILTGITFYM